MHLDETALKLFCEDDSKKNVLAINEPALMKEFLKFMSLNSVFGSTCSAYDVASVIRSYDFWYSKKEIEPTSFPVAPGDVFYVDLGALNIKYETGFMHSSLILKKCGTMVLVAPGSSKKYGKRIFLIEDVDGGDGFTEDTGVLIDQVRCISITRIRGTKIGNVQPDTLKRIQNKFFQNYLPDLYQKFQDMADENSNLKKQNEDKQKLIDELQTKIDDLEQQSKK